MNRSIAIYLARPIDRNEHPGGYRAVVDCLLQDLEQVDPTISVTIYAPGLAFSVMGDLDTTGSATLAHINGHALMFSDVLVLQYIPGVETWGCAQELAQAHEENIKILVITQEGYEYRNLPTYVKAFVTEERVFWNWRNLAATIVDMAHFELPPDSDGNPRAITLEEWYNSLPPDSPLKTGGL